MALIQIGGWAQAKYVPKDNEEFYGTWTNKDMAVQKTVNFPGGYKNYTNISDAEPVETADEQIAEKWTDAEGNIFYKTFGTVTFGIVILGPYITG